MCRECQLNSVYELTNKRKFCKKCFCRYFEKKVLHTIREYKMLDKTKKIFVICTSIKGKIIFSILTKIANKRSLELSKARNFVKTNKYEKIAFEDSLDDGAFLIINNLMNKKPSFDSLLPNITKKTEKGTTKCIRPLYFCLDEEIALYARIKEVKGHIENKEKDNLKLGVKTFINSMERYHPEIKNAIVNALLGIMPALTSR